MYDASAGQK
jgi:hypothetical protein